MVSVRKVATIVLIWALPIGVFTIWLRWWVAQIDDGDLLDQPKQVTPSSAVSTGPDSWIPEGLTEYEQPADSDKLADIACKETELAAHACQLKCRDSTCSAAWKLCGSLPECDGVLFNRADTRGIGGSQGKRGRWATLKRDTTVSKVGRKFFFRFHSSIFGHKDPTNDEFEPGPHHGTWLDDDDHKGEGGGLTTLSSSNVKQVPIVSGHNPDFHCKQTEKGSMLACQIRCKGQGCHNGYAICQKHSECNAISFNTDSPESMAADGLWATLKKSGKPLTDDGTRAYSRAKTLSQTLLGSSRSPGVGPPSPGGKRTECERVCGSRVQGFDAGPFCLKLQGPLGGKVFVCL
jgi:hypothetical protein